jgi:hypothetical protein
MMELPKRKFEITTLSQLVTEGNKTGAPPTAQSCIATLNAANPTSSWPFPIDPGMMCGGTGGSEGVCSDVVKVGIANKYHGRCQKNRHDVARLRAW